MKPRILSGVQPTGVLTLGNYLGAIRNWVDFQDQGECLYCVVDLHAITMPYDPEELRQSTRAVAAAYIASGIDPSKSIIFNQSQVTGHTELTWLLGTQTPLGWLNRMTQFKDKAGKKKEQAGLGLYAYPVLMAADILLYQASHIPVGEDQKQHLELARDIASAFNRNFNQEFFTIPEPQILGEATRVKSLRDGANKMSKSDPSDLSRITFDDDADAIAFKIRKAKSDADVLPGTVEGLEGRPEAENLLTIYATLSNMTLAQACQEFEGQQFSELKPKLTDVLVETFLPVSVEAKRLLQDSQEIDTILAAGSDKARTIANPTITEVKSIMGFLSS